MAKTITAKLTLTDSGPTLSSSTPTAMEFSITYTECYQSTITVAASGTHTFSVNNSGMTYPNFVLIRALDGEGTIQFDIAGGDDEESLTSISDEGGFFMLANENGSSQLINSFLFTNTSGLTTATVQCIAYGI